MTAEEEVKAILKIDDDCCDEQGCFIFIGDGGRNFTWDQALVYAHDLQQKIAEIEEEIKWLKNVQFSYTCLHDLENKSKPWQRTLSRLTAQRDELRKGMKGAE